MRQPDSVTIPNSVTNIGDYTFADCPSLTSVTIPSSVTSIGGSAFLFCPKLSAILVNAVNPVYSSMDGILFNKSRSTLIACPGGKVGSYTIPNSVTSIVENAFMRCTILTSVTIPNSVTSIGVFAFGFCTGLTNVTIPNSVTSIGDRWFFGCNNLTSVRIPSSITYFEESAFDSCTSLTSLYFQGNAPIFNGGFFFSYHAIFYYMPGTTGWGTTFGYHPTALWFPNPVIESNGQSFGVVGNQFGFTVSWATNRSIVVEAILDLTNPNWVPLVTNTLTDGSLTSYFGDPHWTNYPARFYRVRSR